jgi:anti-sigma B factor antagonist
MPEQQPAAAQVRERTLDHIVIAELSGEIDALTAPQVSARLDSLTHRERPDVLVDLRQVTFIDCSGLSVLVRANNRAAARSGRVRLLCTDPRVLRTLQVTQLSGHFTILNTLPVPLRSVSEP